LKPKYHITFYILAILLLSCATKNNLSSGTLENNHSYKIYSYYGCCGCESKYLTISRGKKAIEQIIYSYNCHDKGKPTKFIFNYDKKGKIVSCDKFIATIKNDYTMELSNEEKVLFVTVDNDSTLKQEFNIIRFSQITGFRKARDNEVSHKFPLIKKGYKLPVN